MKFFQTFIISSIVALILFTSCAKRGYITGGDKDTIPPVVLKSFPDNYSTNFQQKEFTILFDEFVRLDNVNQNLIISPPLEFSPEIKPSGATKSITVKITDTLSENTTYSFNFGKAIKDNNEGNLLPNYRYVFSTGNQIDSLKISGKIRDAHNKTNEKSVTVMLYDNATYTDSTVYKKRPLYATILPENSDNFSIENIKEGTYQVIAIKDVNNNYKYEPKSEKVGFITLPVKIPTDSTFTISLFKESPKNNVTRPSMISQNKWLMPFEGDYKKINIEAYVNNQPIKSAWSKVEKKDSLHIFTSPITADSVRFKVTIDDEKKDFIVNTRNLKTKDSLSISIEKSGEIDFRDLISLQTSTPISTINNEKIQLIDKDSTSVPFKIEIDSLHLKTNILFDKKENQKYQLILSPGAIADFFGKSNESQHYNFQTKSTTDYGILNLRIESLSKKYPIILEILDEKEGIYIKEIIKDNSLLTFPNMKPQKYTIRLIFDENNNNKWDTGNLIERKQPEKVYYFSKEIDVRANWDINQTIDVE